MHKWWRWWREGPATVPIPNWLRVALVGYIWVLISRWSPLTIVHEDGHVQSVGAGPWLGRTLIVVGASAGLVAIVARWHCCTLLCLAAGFSVFSARFVEYFFLWNSTGHFNFLGSVSNFGLMIVSVGMAVAIKDVSPPALVGEDSEPAYS